MSVIRIKGIGFGQKESSLANQIKETVHGGNTIYSTESNSIVKALGEGSFESVDLGNIAENIGQVLDPQQAKTGVWSNPNGLKAAALVASMAGGARSYLEMATSMESSGLPEGVRFAGVEGVDFAMAYSTESFDNQSLIDNLSISIGLNYKIARQGPAMELFYRTIPLTPEQGGVDISVPNLYVQNTLQHSTDGSPSDFGLRRVMDSAIDYTVLNDSSTTLIPGYTDVSKDKFVAEGLVQPFDMVVGRRTVKTSALVVGKAINLFGLGQIDSIQRVGQADYTEALDRNIGVESVFLNLGSATIRFDTKGLPFSRFVKTPEQGGRQMKLDFPLTTLQLNKDTVDYAGGALSGGVWDLIENNNYKVRLRTVVNGSADVERGTVNINPGSVEVMSITNAAGVQIALTSTAGKAIVDGLANLSIVGWFPDARLTNSNHRHLGLMLNVRPVTERLLTRLRAPFFVPYPLGEDRDQTVMDWLTFAVGAYINNEAVGTLISYHERLMRLTGGLRGELTVGDFEENSLPVEGIGRYLFNPYIQELDVDLGNAQSTSTVDNIDNGIETLLNVIRSVSFDILQKTNYENACRFVDGGEIVNKWKLAIVTSKHIERFLTVSGDSRTLGAGLPYQLESDVDARLQDSIYISIVREVEGIDPLSAGCMLLTPTLVSTISVTRDNRPVNEAVVQPRFQHYNLLPISVKINVKGVRELLEGTLPFRVENRPVETFGGNTLGVTGSSPAGAGTGTTGTVTTGQDTGAGTNGTGA